MKNPRNQASAQTKTESKITKPIENILLWCLLAFYSLLIIYGFTNHEQWRDEAQAWLIVRDTSFIEFLKVLRTEGHPPLWYLLIMPLAKLGLPYASQSILTVIIMIASVYLLLFRSNLPFILKLLIPFSYYFLYEYSLFARSYCLIAFFAAAIISLYPMRFDKPWLYALCIAGLFNTHVLAFTLAGMLTLIYIWDVWEMKGRNNTNNILAAAFMCISGLYLIPYLFLAKMSDEFFKGNTNHLERIYQAVDNGILITQSQLLAFILLIGIVIVIAKQPKALAVLLGGLVSVFYILGFKYSAASYRHEGLIFFIMLISVSIAAYESTGQAKGIFNIKYVSWVLIAICVIQIKPALSSYTADNKGVLSGAKDAAYFLQEAGHADKILVGHQAWAAGALLPFLDADTKMYYGECKRYGSYYVYDSCFINDNWAFAVDYSVDAAYDNFKGRLDEVVFIFNNPVSERGKQFLDLIYYTPETPIRADEAFYIYKFKQGVK